MRVRFFPGVTLAAALFSVLAAGYSSWQQDVTVDEPIHLEWSRRLLETGVTERGALHFNSKTPIMIPNVIARQLVRRHLDPRDRRVLTLASRLPTLLWHVLLLGAVFWITREFLGRTAAHLATTGAGLEPNLIANASVATVDTAYALFSLLALGAVLLFARRPSLGRALLIGLALGAAFSTKFTAFLLIPGVLLFPLARPRPEPASGRALPGPTPGPGLGFFLGSALVVLAVTCLFVSAAYLFNGMGARLADVPWRSGVLRALASAWPGFLPPVPVDFLTGLDICLASERDKSFNVVILRTLYPNGVWFYYPLVWLWKTPIFLLAAQGAGFARAAWSGLLAASPPLRFLAVNLLLDLVYFCLVFRMQIGFRFVLMCVPLALMVAAAGLAGWRLRPVVAQVAGAALLVVSLLENGTYLGNHIAFTNAAVQPKRNVFRLTGDSNVDFGQNDERVVTWLRENPAPARHVEPVHILPGENVINFNLASGAGLFRRHAWLRAHLLPRDHFRHTYLFFDVTEADFQQFLDEERRLPSTPEGSGPCDALGPLTPLSDRPSVAFPDGGPSLVCVTTEGWTDLALVLRAGELRWGRPGLRPRDYEILVAGQQSWFRLAPGRHALLAEDAVGAAGEWQRRGAPAAWALLPARPSAAPPAPY